MWNLMDHFMKLHEDTPHTSLLDHPDGSFYCNCTWCIWSQYWEYEQRADKCDLLLREAVDLEQRQMMHSACSMATMGAAMNSVVIKKEPDTELDCIIKKEPDTELDCSMAPLEAGAELSDTQLEKLIT